MREREKERENGVGDVRGEGKMYDCSGVDCFYFGGREMSLTDVPI